MGGIKYTLGNALKTWYYRETTDDIVVPNFDPDEVQPGLTRLDLLLADRRLGVKVVELDGTVIHSWELDWFSIWPDAEHIPDGRQPRSRPGTNIHGALILDNGDLIFNFENIGLIRVDPCGTVLWKSPHLTHHSVHLDEDDYLWVPGDTFHEKPVAGLPNHVPRFREPAVLKFSLDGELIRKISIMKVLQHNGLQGLLYLSATSDKPLVTGDTLHLNDVETFPSTLPPGVFRTGDIMVSLRNINAVLVFDPHDLDIKYLSIGGFTRQHDPDFIDGDNISIFDNNRIADPENGQQSRIIIESARSGESAVYFEGSETAPFYTALMGKHQWLDNGNLLITESKKGRVFEVNQSGKVVWEYNNIVSEGVVGIVSDASRLPVSVTAADFRKWASACSPAH